MTLKIMTSIAAFALAMGASVAQAITATVTVIHGINGLDVNSQRDFPVDVAVDGECSLKGIKFTQSKKVTLEDGTYRFTVHPANGSCSLAAVIDQSVTLKSQSSVSLVASLNAAGTPALAVYDNSVLAVAVGVRHVAFSPPLYAKISAASYPSQPVRRIRNGKSGALFAAWDSSIQYSISISSRRDSGVLARLSGTIRSSRVTWRYFYVVGSAKNGLAIVRQDVRPSDLS